nr:glycosyltransferase [Propionibacterium sp.]
MADVPLVTAIVPTYNGAAFIERTLASLDAQTWPNLEILIGDDASTDDTLAVVRRFAEGRAGVRVVERDANLGWLRNTNDLMGRARGEYLFFAFHDDEVEPTYVEELTGALLRRPDAVLAFSDMTVSEVGGAEDLAVYAGLSGSAVARGLELAARRENWWVPNRGVFRAAAYRRVGGIHPNASGEYSADWTWLLHLALLGDFVRVPRVLCRKYYRTASLSKRWPHVAARRANLLRAGVREVAGSSVGWRTKAPVLAVLIARWALTRGRAVAKRVLKGHD